MNYQKLRVLLVEDAGIMRKIEKKALGALGVKTIIEAEDGQKAVQYLEKRNDIDLIISDWNMPNLSGYDLLLWVRSQDLFKQLPFLMATGQGDKKQEHIAIEAGVSSFIAKPFNENELREKIAEAFGQQKTEKPDVSPRQRLRKTESGKVRLSVAHIQITDHLILGVLDALIRKEELKPEHFELETRCLPGWNPVQKSLDEGQVDAAFVLAPIAMDLYSYGAPIRMILLAHRDGSIFVRSSHGEYKEPYSDFFRERSFLIPHKMSVHHMLSHMFFSHIGLNPGMAGEEGVNVNFEVIAPIKMQEYLRDNPGACGFMVAEPLGTRAIAGGAASQQFLSSQLWEQHPCCVVAMRQEFINDYPDAVYEFTDMLVRAGKFIEQKPEISAEIGVGFLDPDKALGLKVPILKNVLTEARGIKTTELYPEINDLQKIQDYMVDRMGIGRRIDLNEFIDTRFAEAACRDRKLSNRSSIVKAGPEAIENLLQTDKKQATHEKSQLNLVGKYLTFCLEHQEFGIDIHKIKEIIGIQSIRNIPWAPKQIKGIINLRGNVIPVMDLRLRFRMPEVPYTDRSCIIVLELQKPEGPVLFGISTDTVSEVIEIKGGDIEPTPFFGAGIRTDHILAMAKHGGTVKILLDIDKIIGKDTEHCVQKAA